MTREHKLALIVGFSLILVVGMLVSDHLSKAKQAKIATVSPAETAIVDAKVPPDSDPMKNLAALTPPPATVSPQQATPPSTLAANPAPAVTPAPATVASAQQAHAQAGASDELIRSDAAPRTLAAGSTDAPLINHIIQQGGTVRKDRNGNIIFGLPSAAEIATKTDPAATSTPTAATAAPKTELAKSNSAPGKIYATSRIDLPPPAADKIHAVQKGESLFQIAAKYYGNGHVWRDLARYNSLKDKEGSVRVGMRLRIPSKDILLGRATPASAATEQKPATTPAVPGAGTPIQASPAPAKRPEGSPARPARIELATYTVKRGDTLGDIAHKVLGSSKRWHEIADFNKLDDEDNIPAGTVLKVPPMRG